MAWFQDDAQGDPRRTVVRVLNAECVVGAGGARRSSRWDTLPGRPPSRRRERRKRAELPDSSASYRSPFACASPSAAWNMPLPVVSNLSRRARGARRQGPASGARARCSRGGGATINGARFPHRAFLPARSAPADGVKWVFVRPMLEQDEGPHGPPRLLKTRRPVGHTIAWRHAE